MSFRGLDGASGFDKVSALMQQGWRDKMDLLQQQRLAASQDQANKINLYNAQTQGYGLDSGYQASGAYGAPQPQPSNQGMQMPMAPQGAPVQFSGNRSPAAEPTPDQQAAGEQADYTQNMVDKGWQGDERGFAAPDTPQAAAIQQNREQNLTRSPNSMNPVEEAAKTAPPKNSMVSKYNEAYKQALSDLHDQFPGAPADHPFFSHQARQLAAQAVAKDAEMEKAQLEINSRKDVAKIAAGSRTDVADIRAAAYKEKYANMAKQGAKAYQITGGQDPQLEAQYATATKLAQAYIRGGVPGITTEDIAIQNGKVKALEEMAQARYGNGASGGAPAPTNTALPQKSIGGRTYEKKADGKWYPVGG